MRIVIAGGHGKIALLLGRLLSARGDQPVGLIRRPEQAADLTAAGLEPVLIDLENAEVAEVAAALAGADAAVFAAGAGPGSGPARKDSVDRGACVLLAEACERAGVARFVQISSMGVESVRGVQPKPDDEAFTTYLHAKLAAEEDLRARPLAWTVLRPGALTDDPPTGAVQLGPAVGRGTVPRADVAAVVVGLLAEPRSAGLVLGLIAGQVPIGDAILSVLDPA